jgi:crotonobetainyl-CoA:carnitine CoA-transferase CaiB-like acyl-CoA transferase
MGADVVKLEAPGGDITRMQLRDIPTSTASTSQCSGCPMKLSDSPVDVHPSPLRGEHNEGIYGRELGRDDQLASLKAKGIPAVRRRAITVGCRPASIKRI